MGNITRNPQSQPITLLLPRQAKVRFENLLQPLFRHPRPLIIDMQDKRAVIVIDVQVRVLPILQGIVDQVANAALERQRLTRIRRQRPSLLGHPAIAIGRQVRFHQTIEHMIEVHRFDILVNVGVFHALQRAFDQQLQLVQIAPELGLQLFVLQQFDPQAQAGNGRAQIMGDGTEQLAALGQITTDAGTHGIEGARHLDHFTAAAHLDRLDLVLTQRHVPGRSRQTLERTALPVHQQADEQQQKNTAEHDKPHLQGRQPLLFETGVGLGQQGGDIQPFTGHHLDLCDQDRRIDRLQRQCKMRPGAR
ncbi:hypothetical protein PS685_05027 [Pseudomonas fluorescens]|uniref:Uncharacterized protein n=1 Tax=Pseudomonas fluorescens TaxID=294 RepID=A0A5E6ZWG7_PSEFL|nr:hypothetical protein PS685_05027 [Pseudomonas fluorescens]